MSRRTDPVALPWLLGALAVSGVAGIINQVGWQRALKIFLGGSETLSSMVVVLVFLGGLGLGAALASRWASRTLRPLAGLAALELGLAAVNALIAAGLGLDVAESVYAVQRVALGLGIPLRAVYAVLCAAVLVVPTALMGATLPLASEACQRQLGARTTSLLPALFFVNTVGAAAGALGSSLWLLPHYGQRATLLAAVGLNAGAALVLALAALRTAPAEAAPPTPPSARRGLSREEKLGGALGFLALGYEMVLLRTLVLANMPLPYTFAAGLCAFLLAWSLGVALASLTRRGLPAIAALTAACVAAVPAVFAYDVQWGLGLPLGAAIYALPAVGFGLLYGQLVSRAADRWGRDVGRYQAVNTVGSCVGVGAFTLLGYELSLHVDLALIAIGVAGIGLVELRGALGRWGAVAAAVASGAIATAGWMTPYTEDRWGRTYWGRDGVVEVTPDDQVYIDGLWHTKLTDGHDHLGRPYSWVMAAAAVLARGGQPERALVIGAGVGISSATLAGVEGLHIDSYEINHTLERVLRDYPDRTLHAADHPRIHWRWRDARTGLALDETRYDLILSAPLHLKQAGSSLLLSREYLELVRSRLAPGGVLAVYSNEGDGSQALLVQRTIAEVFPHSVTWYDGVVTLAADHPLELRREELRARMQTGDGLARELREVDGLIRDGGGQGLWDWYDGPVTDAWVADRPITDDQPLVEYPDIAQRTVRPVRRSELPDRR